MEFDILSFANKLKEYFIGSTYFPYYEQMEQQLSTDANGDLFKRRRQSAKSKHPNRHPTHLREIAKQSLETSTIIADNLITFDYGNVAMETNYPHYHILQNTPNIRKKYRGTEKTKGSQSMFKIAGERDYERVNWNGKTFTKEYSRNVRGSRNRLDKVSHWELGKSNTLGWSNPKSGSYYNVHYNYIDTILDQDVVGKLASDFNLEVRRKQDSGLIDEFSIQEVDTVLEAFGSFM